MTTKSEDVRGGPAPNTGEVVNLDGVGLAIGLRLEKRGVRTVAAVAAMDPAALQEAAGVGADRAARILAAARAAAAGEPPPAPPESAAAPLVGSAAGFTLAPMVEVEAPGDLAEDVLAQRLGMLSLRAAGRPKGPLASARACPSCGLIISYPRPDIRRARQQGEMPMHGSKFNYSPHLCDGRGTVSAGNAGSALRQKIAANRENDPVFRDYDRTLT